MKLGFFTFIVSGLLLLGSASSFALVENESSQEEKLPCGLTGSIDERIKDCNSVKGWFALVTRTENLKEVHMDSKTGLLWSDRLASTMTHYNAEKVCSAKLEEVGKINEVEWRLPSKEEYVGANMHGMRISLPNMEYYFWSSSLDQDGYGSDGAWLYNGKNGSSIHAGYRVNNTVSVRCVAYEPLAGI